MTATTHDRNTQVMYPQRQTAVPLATSAIIPAGVLVAVTGSTGLAANGGASDTAGQRVIGRSEHAADQTAGDTVIHCGRGVYGFAATSGLAAVGQANVGKTVYVKDNQTVGLSTDTTNLIPAGTLEQIDGSIYYVTVGLGRSGLQPDAGSVAAVVANAAVDPAVAMLGLPVVIPIDIPDAATATYAYITPSKIEIIDVIVIKDGAGAANTIQVTDSADAAITNAIAAAVDKTSTRAGTIDKAKRVLAASAGFKIVATRAAGTMAAQVFIVGILRA